MWLISVHLSILINLIGALNKSESISSNPLQFSQLNQQSHSNLHANQLTQFTQQPKQSGGLNQLTKITQFSQQKEISCTDNQTISFIKYPNHKLSLNFLNKLNEFTISDLLNQSDLISSKTVERIRKTLDYSRPITQLCHEACKTDLDCLAFSTNLKQSSCYLIKEDYRTNSKDYLIFDTTNNWNFYEKLCLNKARTTCNQIWSFDIHPSGHLNNLSSSKQIQLMTVSFEECLNVCSTNRNDTLTFKCRSVNYDSRKAQCTLNQHNRRIVPEAYVTQNQFTSTDNLIYAENHCVPFTGKCVFRHLPAYYLPDYQIYDVESGVNSVDSCEQLCINQSQYVCRAYAYSKQLNQCAMSPEASSNLINPIASVNRRSNARRLEVLNPSPKLQDKIQQQILNQPNTFAYHERTSCINVKIDCDANGMHTKVYIDGPFTGRLFTTNNFEKCSKSNFDSSLEHINLTIPLDPNECGTLATGNGTFSNRLILQYHPLILKESDRRIEVSCDYHLIKQKVRGSKRRILEGGGLSASQVMITGLAESPPVKLKILNEDKEEVRGAKLGDTLFFKVEISDESVFGIFGSSLVAKSGSGNESLLLIDDHGCPLEPSIFPAVNVKNSDTSKSLTVPFQAFKFATDSTIKFQMTISFCLDSCAVIVCDNLDMKRRRDLDLTVSRKRRSTTDQEFKTGDIVTDVKMETNFFIISDDENGVDTDTTLLMADMKQQNQSKIGNGLLVTKGRNGHRHYQTAESIRFDMYYPHPDLNDRICFSPVLVYLFSMMALIVQLLLIFFCTCIICNNRKSYYHQTSRVNSRSSQFTTDVQSVYSLRTGNSKTYNSNLIDTDLDCLNNGRLGMMAVNGSLTNDFRWPLKSSRSSKNTTDLVSIFNNKHADNHFNIKEICIT